MTPTIDLAPEYRGLMERLGLVTSERVLALPGVIVCGHPDRHVARVTLGSGPGAVNAFLKREHRVRWKDRALNALAGFGLVSKSLREAATLRALRRAGVGCPEVIAAGEDGHGRAFLLVRELAGRVDLRVYLVSRLYARPQHRLRLAQKLGEALARIHDAGFDHPDLYSKHVLVHLADRSIHFLDWQRSRRRDWVGWRRRWRDLAALDATLADDLASPFERLACLHAYLRASLGARIPPELLRQTARRIRARSGQLLRRRAIREARHEPLAAGAQSLIWLDGEAACVTRKFWEEFCHRVPTWLPLVSRLAVAPNQAARHWVSVGPDRRALLVRRRRSRPFARLWEWLCGRPATSPEARRAGLLFRLQRFGVPTPEVLAFGHRHSFPGQTDSFLLVEPVPGAVNLMAWLDRQAGRPLWTAERKRRWEVVRQAAEVLRRMHEAHCYYEDGSANPASGVPLVIQPRPRAPSVALEADAPIQARRHPSPVRVVRDLAFLRGCLPAPLLSRTDQLRFLCKYLGVTRLTPAAKALAGKVCRIGPLGPVRYDPHIPSTSPEIPQLPAPEEPITKRRAA